MGLAVRAHGLAPKRQRVARPIANEERSVSTTSTLEDLLAFSADDGGSRESELDESGSDVELESLFGGDGDG